MRLLFILGAGIALLNACADRDPGASVTTVAGDRPRIVTLAPHLTEMVYTAGAGDYLVGVVAHSDYPEQARSLPVIGDAFRIDPERLAAVEPNLILAWPGGNPDEAIAQLVARGYTVAALPADTLADVAKNIIEIGRLTNESETARAQAERFEAALESLRAAHRERSPLKVFYQISLQPLYTVGGRHPISEMIALCGGRSLFADLEQLAPVVSLEDVLSRNPDVIIAGDDAAQLESWRRWDGLSAADGGNLFVVEAALVTRPGIRMLQGAQQICDRLERARSAKVFGSRENAL